DFSEVIQEATDKQGANVILDFIGAPYWKKNLASISIDGRWVLIGVLGGNTVEKVKLMDLMTKRIQLTGTLLTPRSNQYNAELTTDYAQKALSLYTSEKLKTKINKIYPLEEVQQAHEQMEANKNIGKIILSV